MLENGDLDWAGAPTGNVPLDAMQTLKEKGLLEITPKAGTYWYEFNTEQKPFNNKKIRQAFSYAINRKDIVENVTRCLEGTPYMCAAYFSAQCFTIQLDHFFYPLRLFFQKLDPIASDLETLEFFQILRTRLVDRIVDCIAAAGIYTNRMGEAYAVLQRDPGRFAWCTTVGVVGSFAHEGAVYGIAWSKGSRAYPALIHLIQRDLKRK